MNEHPVLELHHKGLVAEAEVIALRGHRKALHGALDGIAALIQLRIERDDIDDERAVLVEPGLLLDDDGVLVLDPGLEHRAAIVDRISPGVVVILDKADENATHGEIGVLMRKGQDDLLQLVNDVISQMKRDGSLRRLHEKYGLVYEY